MSGNLFLTYHAHLQIQNLDIVKLKKNAWHSRGRARDRVIIFEENHSNDKLISNH